MTRALWRAPSIAAGHLGRGPIARTLVVAAEAGAPHRSEGEGAAVARCRAVSRADQGRRETGNRRMTRALWPAPRVAAGRPGRGRAAATLVMAAEAGARRRDVERDDGSAMVTARVADDSSQTYGTVKIHWKPAFQLSSSE